MRHAHQVDRFPTPRKPGRPRPRRRLVLERLEDRTLLSLFPALSYCAGRLSIGLAVGDLNGDGHQDLVAANSAGSQPSDVTVLLGTGSGAFGVPRNYAVGNGPGSVAVGDLNGDGRQDLAVTKGTSHTVSVLLGSGDGTFGPPVDFAVGRTPRWVALGDFNGDSALDLVTANQSDNNVTIRLGNGDGTFQAPVPYATGVMAFFVVVSHFDQDTALDLAVANYGSHNLSVLRGRGDGTFDPAVSYPVGNNPQAVVAADFDGDGPVDLVVTNYQSHSVSFLRGTSAGTFEPARHSAAGQAPTHLAAADFDGDTVPDLAVTYLNGSTIAVLRGAGDGTFGPPVSSPVGSGPFGIVVGDFDGDQAADVATAGGSGVSVLLGRAASPVRFQIDAPAASPAGGAFFATVSAVDAVSGAPVGYCGTVRFFSSDPAATLPADYRFRFAEGGSAPFMVTLARPGSHKIAVNDVIHRRAAGTAVIAVGDPVHFTPAERYAVGRAPRALTTGDFNRDGVLDLVAANSLGSTVNVLLGNGDGTFRPGGAFAVAGLPTALVVDDFNGDTLLDVAAAGGSDIMGRLSVLLGNGDGTFAPGVMPQIAPLPSGILARDLDSDGVLDLVTVHMVGTFSGGFDGYCTLRGTGTGSFQSLGCTRLFRSLTAGRFGDVNADGFADLVVSGGVGVQILLGTAGGTFLVGANYRLSGFSTAVVVTDVNGDAILDLAVAERGIEPSDRPGNVQLLLGNGDGTFRPPVAYPVGFGPQSLEAGDFNGDGLVDLVTANELGNSLSVLLGNGDGTFQDALHFGAGRGAAAVVVGDWDGNGYADLAAANAWEDTVGVLSNLADWFAAPEGVPGYVLTSLLPRREPLRREVPWRTDAADFLAVDGLAGASSGGDGAGRTDGSDSAAAQAPHQPRGDRTAEVAAFGIVFRDGLGPLNGDAPFTIV